MLKSLQPLARLLASASALATTPAQAEDWWFIGPADEYIGIVDADSIQVTGERRTAMIRGYGLRGPRVIAGARIEVDCAAGRSRRLRVFVYSPELAPIEEVEPPAEAREWQTYQPNQSGDIAIRFVCGWRPQGDFPTRIGRLYGGPHDKEITFVLIDLDIPVPLAVQFGLGDLEPQRAEALLRDATPEAADILRRSGFPRLPPAASSR